MEISPLQHAQAGGQAAAPGGKPALAAAPGDAAGAGSPARHSEGLAGLAGPGAGLLQPGVCDPPPRPRCKTSTAAHGWQTQS